MYLSQRFAQLLRYSAHGWNFHVLQILRPQLRRVAELCKEFLLGCVGTEWAGSYPFLILKPEFEPQKTKPRLTGARNFAGVTRSVHLTYRAVI